jgi:hypothetical protein
MQEIVDVHLLNDLLQKTKSNISRNKWKYFHSKSVENFIFHLNKIKDKEKRELSYRILHDYLQITSAMDESELDISSGEDLYRQFLTPLIPIYIRYQRFITFATWDVQLYILITLVVLFLVAGVNLIYLALLVIIFKLRQLFKRRKRRVFGAFY